MKDIRILSLEAFAVGFLLIIFVYIASFILRVVGYPTVKTPLVCQDWDRTYIMEATLVLAGVLFHVGFEITGLNKMYVDNYYLLSNP